ncbi:MAG: hypothetical protein ACK5MD_01295 [Flavobacteriales bacterium]
MKKIFLVLLSISLIAISCDNKKRRGINYDELKKELTLSEEQATKFDEVVTKYKKIAEESRAASKAEGAKLDRVEAFKKMEERNHQQSEEMAAFLDEAQMKKYTAFIEKNARKRPRYDDKLLTQIKTDLNLNDDQSKVLEAANNAFEKSFHDAHDIYHGNSELAKEYWIKFDNERKNAVKSVLSEEQYNQFLEIIEPHDRYKDKE